jgi:hypothetical protein
MNWSARIDYIFAIPKPADIRGYLQKMGASTDINANLPNDIYRRRIARKPYAFSRLISSTSAIELSTSSNNSNDLSLNLDSQRAKLASSRINLVRASAPKRRATLRMVLEENVSLPQALSAFAAAQAKDSSSNDQDPHLRNVASLMKRRISKLFPNPSNTGRLGQAFVPHNAGLGSLYSRERNSSKQLSLFRFAQQPNMYREGIARVGKRRMRFPRAL